MSRGKAISSRSNSAAPAARLSLNEQKVIAAVRFNAKISLVKLARSLDLQVKTARRCLESLLTRELLVPYAVINPFLLGFTDYGIYWTCSGLGLQARTALMNFLRNSPHVPWYVEYAGDYPFAFSIVARTVSELDEILLQVGRVCAGRRVRQVVIARAAWHIFGERYLCPRPESMRGYTLNGPAIPVELDQTDWRILRNISAPRPPSETELARRLGLPLSTVAYRLRTLERKNVIVCYAYAANLERLAVERYKLLITDMRSTPESRAALIEYLKGVPRIVAVTVCVGEWDYEVEVQVDAPLQLAEIQAGIATQFPELMIRSLNILRVHKLQPLPTDD